MIDNTYVLDALLEIGVVKIDTYHPEGWPTEAEVEQQWMGDHNWLQHVRTPIQFRAPSEHIDPSANELLEKKIGEHRREIENILTHGVRNRQPRNGPHQPDLYFAAGLFDESMRWDVNRVRLAWTRDPWVRTTEPWLNEGEINSFSTLVMGEPHHRGGKIVEAIRKWYQSQGVLKDTEARARYRGVIEQYARACPVEGQSA